MGSFNAEVVFFTDPTFYLNGTPQRTVSRILLSIFAFNFSNLKINNLYITEMRWERGDITFLYKGDSKTPEESLFVLDNKLRVYQKVS